MNLDNNSYLNDVYMECENKILILYKWRFVIVLTILSFIGV